MSLLPRFKLFVRSLLLGYSLARNDILARAVRVDLTLVAPSSDTVLIKDDFKIEVFRRVFLVLLVLLVILSVFAIFRLIVRKLRFRLMRWRLHTVL